MEQCDHNCATCQETNCEERKIEKLKPNEFASFKKTIAIISGKGGVGKSAVATLLATSLSKQNKKVAIMDADVTGPSIPQGFGLSNLMATSDDSHIYPVRSKGGIPIMSANLLLQSPSEPIVWRGPLISSLVQQMYTDVAYGEMEYLVIDMPPGTGDVPLTVFQMIPVDGIVVVTTPQDLVSVVVEKSIKMAKMMNVPIIGIVANLAYILCPKCHEKIELYGDVSKIYEVAKRYKLEVLAELPIDQDLSRLIDEGRVEEYNTSKLDKLIKKIG